MDEKFALCTEQALRYLSLREHNEKELRLKLKQKNYDENTIESTLTFLKEDGSLSEMRYALSFVRSSNKRHPEGKSMLLQRLLAKGADKETSVKALDELYTEDYIRSLVSDAVSKLTRKGKTDNIKAELFRLGFRPSDIALFYCNE